MKHLLAFVAIVAVTALPMPWVARSPLHRFPSDVKDLPPAQWFTQELDHFTSQDQRTWQQRFYVNDTYWTQGGPIFLQVGGEGAISPQYVTELQFVNYAQTYGAVCVALEHRFYGESMPLSDLSTENLVYLSSDQALADLGHFIVNFKRMIGASEDTPVVTFGGSYPGNLAAWFRIKYPSLTIGSIASSAPVQATLDFYQYLDVVDNSLADISGQSCDSLIREASSYVDQLITSGQSQVVDRLFNTCTPIGNDPLNVANFISNIMGNFMGTVQYDDEGGNPITIATLCNIMENATSAIDGYVAVSNLFLQAYEQTCVQTSYEQMLEELEMINMTAVGVGARSWTYQTCAEFGYFQTTDSDAQPFGDLVPLSFYTDICQNLGWNFTTRINETNEKYGGKDPSGSTNITFVNGSLDPWHSLSIIEDLGHHVKAIFINGTAHCANMFPARPQDPPGLAKAQIKIRERIGQYLETDVDMYFNQ